jgi:hypothetical protein
MLWRGHFEPHEVYQTITNMCIDKPSYCSGKVIQIYMYIYSGKMQNHER